MRNTGLFVAAKLLVAAAPAGAQTVYTAKLIGPATVSIPVSVPASAKCLGTTGTINLTLDPGPLMGTLDLTGKTGPVNLSAPLASAVSATFHVQTGSLGTYYLAQTEVGLATDTLDPPCYFDDQHHKAATGTAFDVTLGGSCTFHTLNLGTSAQGKTVWVFKVQSGVLWSTDTGAGDYCAAPFPPYYVQYDPSSTEVTSIRPGVVSNAGPPGLQDDPVDVTIEGSNFQPGARVVISGLSTGSTTVVDDHTITTRITGFKPLREGALDVLVINPDDSRGTGIGLFYVTSLVVVPEINQGVPLECASDRPCVAEHNTVVRVGLTCDDADCETGKEKSVGWLHVIGPNGPLPNSPFAAQPGFLMVQNAFTPIPLGDRALAKETLNFYFNGTFIPEGTFDISFEIDPKNPLVYPSRAAHPDDAHNLVVRLRSRVFKKSRTDRAIRVAVILDANGPGRDATLRREYAAAPSRFDLLRAMYPISADLMRADVVSCPIGWQGVDQTFSLAAYCYTAAYNASTQDPIPFTHAFFFTGDQGYGGPGASDCIGGACFAPVAIVKLKGGETPVAVAHEMGHLFLFGDTYQPPSVFSTKNSVDNAACQIFTNGCAVDTGSMDSLRREVSVQGSGSPPDRSYVKRDFMGNALRAISWTDKRTWEALYNQFLGPLSSNGRRVEASPGSWISISGAVGKDGTASFNPFSRFTGQADASVPLSGEYALELQDAAGAVLSATSFALSFQIADVREA
ncbi:MAG TPA: IPT/TIG domain-containing protein, partial [Thermoanaerobaculia bacterium]|nr:IPT/TIG domain-containing protein [Thermoanaerobaculia bacterium]